VFYIFREVFGFILPVPSYGAFNLTPRYPKLPACYPEISSGSKRPPISYKPQFPKKSPFPSPYFMR